jgi:hypothetical protein
MYRMYAYLSTPLANSEDARLTPLVAIPCLGLAQGPVEYRNRELSNPPHPRLRAIIKSAPHGRDEIGMINGETI